ncbi:MAG: hypothetical protein WEF50_04630 [Myxococcota bacterium]
MTKPRSRAPIESGHRYHSPAEEAARLGVSETLVLEGCRNGTLPHTRIGRRILLDPLAVDQVLAATAVTVDAAIKKTLEAP